MIACGLGLLPDCSISTIWIFSICISSLLPLRLCLPFLTSFWNLLWIFSNGCFLHIALEGLFVGIDWFRAQIGDLDDLYLFLRSRFLPGLLILLHLGTYFIGVDEPWRDFFLAFLEGRLVGSGWFEGRRLDGRFPNLKGIQIYLYLIDPVGHSSSSSSLSMLCLPLGILDSMIMGISLRNIAQKLMDQLIHFLAAFLRRRLLLLPTALH